MPRKYRSIKRATPAKESRAIKRWLRKVSHYLAKPRQSGKGLLDEVILPTMKDNKYLSNSAKWGADNALSFIPGVGNIARGIGYIGAAGLNALGYGKKSRRRRQTGRGGISDFISSKSGQQALGALTTFFG